MTLQVLKIFLFRFDFCDVFNEDNSKQINLLFKIGEVLYGHHLLNVLLEPLQARSLQLRFRTFFFGKFIKTEKETFKNTIDVITSLKIKFRNV